MESPDVAPLENLLACLEVPALPLQLLLKQKPEWRELPVVVISEDRPQGIVTWLNAKAREFRILPGQTYAAALGLCRDLRASIVPPAAIGTCIAHLITLLRTYCPRIEPSDDEPGVFWLDTRGLWRLWPPKKWAYTIIDALAAITFSSVMAIGFSHFGTYAAARAIAVALERPTQRNRPPLLTFTSPPEERALIDRIPLAYLALDPDVRLRLDRLGVRRLGELIALPATGIGKRYGLYAYRLHRLATGAHTRSFEPRAELTPARDRLILDFLEHDAHRLLFLVKSLLDGLLLQLELRQAVVSELILDLGYEAQRCVEFKRHAIRPAAPTLDAALLLDLVRLRLENVDLQRGVIEVHLELAETPATPEQSRMFGTTQRRDTTSAARALARIQAELGAEAVVNCVLRDAHLPLARQSFVPFDGKLAPPKAPPNATEQSLVRRLHLETQPMPARPRNARNEAWQTRNKSQLIVRLRGPYVASENWWLPDREIQRDYYFAETTTGDWLWIFYDRRQRRWFEEGVVQ